MQGQLNKILTSPLLTASGSWTTETVDGLTVHRCLGFCCAFIDATQRIVGHTAKHDAFTSESQTRCCEVLPEGLELAKPKETKPATLGVYVRYVHVCDVYTVDVNDTASLSRLGARRNHNTSEVRRFSKHTE